MELLKDISIIWSLLHTLVLFLFLFESRYSREKTITITLATMIPLSIMNLLLFAFLGANAYGTLMLLTLSLPSCVVFWIMSKHRDGRFFFTFCMVDTIVLEIIYISNIINHYLTPQTYLVLFVIRLLAYPLLELLVYKRVRPMFLEVQNNAKRGWGVFAIIGVSFYLVITLLMTYPTQIVERPEYIPVLAIMFLLMPVIYINIIRTLRKHQQLHEISEQERIMKIQVSNLLARMEELNAANDAFRKERHDFRHKLATIATLIENGRNDEVYAVIQEYTRDIEKTAVKRYCIYPVLDATLSVYINKAEKAAIRVDTGFAFPEEIHVSEAELATALANAIENAIHACESLPAAERFIEIKVISKPQFMIMVKNSFNGQVVFDANGIPQSKKKNHGFGTASIAAFCKKAGGHCQFLAEDNVFTLYMRLR